MKCIILAGGSGERLWPISRGLRSKSLLRLTGQKTLIQNAFETALSITSPKNIITITNVRLFDDTRLQLQEIAKNPVIISEPVSKNTAGTVAAALEFIKSTRDEFVVIMPVDFNVEDKSLFKETIEEAKSIAKKGYIVALGVKPEYAEEGFGYIQTGETIQGNVKHVVRFIEKPSAQEAAAYTKKTEYLWNCGIYAGKVSVFEEAYKKYAPVEYLNFSKEMFDKHNQILYEYYENIPEISVDYAVMEKILNMAAVELKTKWTDFGSWNAIYNNGKKDSKKNVITGNVITNNVKNSLVYSSKELTAVSNVSDTLVIDTEDALLVCDKSRVNDIKRIVDVLKENKNKSVFSHKTVFRPWGFYTCLTGGCGWLSKIITVSPGHRLSLQSHNFRSEHWVVLEGTATVILNEDTIELQKRGSIDIPLKTKHSLQNNTNETLKILEVQKGDYIGEDDIIRYEDMYGRTK